MKRTFQFWQTRLTSGIAGEMPRQGVAKCRYCQQGGKSVAKVGLQVVRAGMAFIDQCISTIDNGQQITQVVAELIVPVTAAAKGF